MNKITKAILGAGILVGILLTLNGIFGNSVDTDDYPLSSVQLISSEGFSRAEEPRTWVFPDDFGPHPEYQTEWWYYTGNVEGPENNEFGYQLTFFRRGLIPPRSRVDGVSKWRTEEVYMAHFALTDFDEGEHYYFEKFSRGSAGLAGASSNPFQVWLENWGIYTVTDNQLQLTAEQDGIKLDLLLVDNKGLTFHGNQGYSKKGLEPGNASHYFSQTRLSTTGTIHVNGLEAPVTGLSWMDHEFSTSALSAGQIGWDWFSIQLDDGSDLMVYQIRRDDGSIDRLSNGTYISPTTEASILSQEDFVIEVQQSWKSPSSGAVYPSAWNIRIPELNISLELLPVIKDQELELSFVYWEGAVEVTGTVDSQSVAGKGYVELTGYLRAFDLDF